MEVPLNFHVSLRKMYFSLFSHFSFFQAIFFKKMIQNLSVEPRNICPNFSFLMPPKALVFVAPWPLPTLSMPSLAVDLNTRLRVIGVRHQIFGVRI